MPTLPPVNWTQLYAVMGEGDGHVELCTWNHFDHGKGKPPDDFIYRYDLDPFSDLERTVALTGKAADAMELRLCRGQDAVDGLARGQDSALCQDLLKPQPHASPSPRRLPIIVASPRRPARAIRPCLAIPPPTGVVSGHDCIVPKAGRQHKKWVPHSFDVFCRKGGKALTQRLCVRARLQTCRKRHRLKHGLQPLRCNSPRPVARWIHQSLTEAQSLHHSRLPINSDQFFVCL